MACETGFQSQVKSYQKLKNCSWCLSIIVYGSSVRGAIQRKELRSPLHLGVLAIEKGAFRSPSTTVDQLIYIYIYIYILTEFILFLQTCVVGGGANFTHSLYFDRMHSDIKMNEFLLLKTFTETDSVAGCRSELTSSGLTRMDLPLTLEPLRGNFISRGNWITPSSRLFLHYKRIRFLLCEPKKILFAAHSIAEYLPLFLPFFSGSLHFYNLAATSRFSSNLVVAHLVLTLI